MKMYANGLLEYAGLSYILAELNLMNKSKLHYFLHCAEKLSY